MAGPGQNYRILKDNRSSYNLIAHDHHVPHSPLFGPSSRPYEDKGPGRGDGRGGGRRDYPTEEQVNILPVRNPMPVTENNFEKPQADLNQSLIPDLRHHQHVPASPLYVPGQGHARQHQGHSDPRYGSAKGGRKNMSHQEHESVRQVPQLMTSAHSHVQPATQRGIYKDRHQPTIGVVDNMPVSPLYIPSFTNRDAPARAPVSLQGQNKYGSPEPQQRSPSPPPTPPQPQADQIEEMNFQQQKRDYNSDNDVRLHLPQNDEHERNWAGYKEMRSPYLDKPGYERHRYYRSQPYTDRDNRYSEPVSDPRLCYGGPGQHSSASARNGGALLLIRFPIGYGENVGVAAQCFLKSKTIDLGGRFLGIADRVEDFGYEPKSPEALGVFHFPSKDKALKFFQMDPIIRQPDFPPPYGCSEMWIICNAYLPDNLEKYNTFLISEVELHPGRTRRQFFEEFQVPMENCLQKNGAMPFVICSYGNHDRQSLRRHSYHRDTIVSAHLFQGKDHLNWIIDNDASYAELRHLHWQLATEKCSVFSLERDVCK